jgi:hypothetical protein
LMHLFPQWVRKTRTLTSTEQSLRLREHLQLIVIDRDDYDFVGKTVRIIWLDDSEGDAFWLWHKCRHCRYDVSPRQAVRTSQVRITPADIVMASDHHASFSIGAALAASLRRSAHLISNDQWCPARHYGSRCQPTLLASIAAPLRIHPFLFVAFDKACVATEASSGLDCSAAIELQLRIVGQRGLTHDWKLSAIFYSRPNSRGGRHAFARFLEHLSDGSQRVWTYNSAKKGRVVDEGILGAALPFSNLARGPSSRRVGQGAPSGLLYTCWQPNKTGWT